MITEAFANFREKGVERRRIARSNSIEIGFDSLFGFGG
jgi:hypothetical protein